MGGRVKKVMEMLDDHRVGRARGRVHPGLLDENKKIMGFGHRVYKAEDPRTKHLRGIVRNLCYRDRTNSLCNKCSKIEKIVHDEEDLPNLDFYSAVAMDALESQKNSLRHSSPQADFGLGRTCHRTVRGRGLASSVIQIFGEFGRKFVPIEER